MNCVENLSKVSLLIRAGASPDLMDIEPNPIAFDFVFGVAVEGMTLFEFELIHKQVGEEICIHLKKKLYPQFFEHIRPPLDTLFDGREEAYLKVKITGVAPADDRSILKAMAEATAHGGGDCGCGCGCG